MSAIPRGEALRWLERWDRHQEGYLPAREARFDALLDLVEARRSRPSSLLDLGCGPGSLSARALRRFPTARVTALDLDPVLLEVGRSALGRAGGRLTWVDADLRSPDWTRKLPSPRRYDAVVSTTALHWLALPALRQLYRTIPSVLRSGGVFLNGDHLPPRHEIRTVRSLYDRAERVARRRYAARAPPEGWQEFWGRLAKVPALAAEFAERHQRFPHAHGGAPPIPLETHLAALRASEFQSVGVAWQNLEDRIVFAVR